MKVPRPLATMLACLTLSLTVLAQSFSFQVRVVAVEDGATVRVADSKGNEYPVKCQAADAPGPDQASGITSRRRLTELTLGKTVTVEYVGKDQGGRVVGRVILNGRDVCLSQVREGLARYEQTVGRQSSSEREVFADAEARARSMGLGLWAPDSGLPPAPPQPAGEDIRQRRAPVGSTPSQAAAGVVPATPTTAAGSSSPAAGEVSVSGYFRRDGTWVAPHKRTSPDGNFDNNWSTRGNVNPYTGVPGTKTRSWFSRNWGWVVTPLVGAGLYFSLKNLKFSGGGIPCNDGTTSNAANRQGACSHHGGIRPGF